MAFKTEENNSIFIIHCPEYIDAIMGKQIKIQQDKWLATELETIALNFSSVTEVDSDGFRALSILAKAAKDKGKKFVTVNPNKKVLAEIKKVGLEGALNPLQPQ